RLRAQQPGLGRPGLRPRLVFDAAETRCAQEADALARPLVVPARHVAGDERNVRGAADEFVFDGSRWRSDEVEDGGAVGRRNRDPALAGLKPRVDDETKAELVEVEAEAAVEVAHEDAHRVDAQKGRSDTRRQAGGGRRPGRVAG